MIIESNYEITVSKLMNDNRYHHFCRIELGNHLELEIMDKYAQLKQKFPKEEGWLLELKRVECYGKIMERSN